MSCQLRCIKFQVGFACNMACPFCLVQGQNTNSALSVPTILNAFADETLRKNLQRVVVTGGEPTLPQYLPLTLRIINQAVQCGASSTIYSNGKLLTDDILQSLKKTGLTEIRLSLYDPIDWQEYKETLDRMEGNGFKRFLKFTVTRESFAGLGRLLENLGTLRPDRFQIKPFNQTGIPSVDERHEMLPEQVLEMSRIMLDYRRKATFQVDLLPLCYEFLVEDVPVEKIAKCNCGKGSEGYLVLDPKGFVYPCGAYAENIGNVNTPGTSLSQIWNDSKLLKQIRNLESLPPDECQGCKHFNVCKVNDCHSTTFNFYRNFLRGNPQCPILARKRFASKGISEFTNKNA
jgi:radical SAM protein with 4Fe4S-binding SPASM domain